MDITTLMNAMLSSEGITGISQATQVPTNDVSSILEQALPMLLQGANQQATSKDTAAGFVEALTDHAQDDTTDIAKFLQGVDLEDGAKIVKHLMGANAPASVAKTTGVKKAQANDVMSAAAPLLMSLLGQQTTGKAAKKAQTTDLVSSMLSNVDMSKIAKAALTAAAAGAVKKAVTGGSKKTTSKKKNDIDLSDGLDAGEVIKIVGKLMK